MKTMRKITMVATAALFAAGLAYLPTPVDPHGPDSGASRAIAAWPTPVDPTGPNSGVGRTVMAAALGRNPLTGEPTSGGGRNPLTGAPTSGAGRNPLTGEPTSGAGRDLA
jgi:hypothetical protein